MTCSQTTSIPGVAIEITSTIRPPLLQPLHSVSRGDHYALALPSLSAATIVLGQLQLAAIQFSTIQLLHGILHVIISGILNNTTRTTGKIDMGENS